MFINHYLPVQMCPRYILSDNGMEFKNHLMDQVFQQHRIDHIFSTPYHPKSNGKLEVFHKYLNPTLKKLCKKEQIHKSSSHKLQSNTKPCHSRNTILSCLWKRHQPAITPTSRTYATIHFMTVQKTTDREPPSLKIGNRVYFKNKQPGK